MTDLERLALGLFNRFAIFNGAKANWIYLSKERKIEWMKEVIIHTDYLLNEWRSRIKPAPKPQKGESSYGVGFFNGMLKEKQLNQDLLDYLDQDLKQQLEDYINEKD